MNCSVIGCKHKLLAKGFCSTHYKRFVKYGDPNVKQEKSKKVDFEIDENNCFNCISHSKSKEGYASIYSGGKPIKMHRFIFKEMFGEIPKGLVVRHKCDNPSCINPEHLELGTIADNNRDREERGRSNPSKGSKNGFSKLTEGQVEEIKTKLNNGVPISELRKTYKIGQTTLYMIKNNERWQHVK